MQENGMLAQDIEESLRQATELLSKHGRVFLSEMEITFPQFNALLVLKEHGSLTMGELCKHMFTACSTATDLADRMEDAGLVERRRDKGDRRVVRIHLCSKGEEIVNEVIGKRQMLLAQALNGCPKDEMEQMLSIVKKLKQSVESVPFPDK